MQYFVGISLEIDSFSADQATQLRSLRISDIKFSTTQVPCSILSISSETYM